MAAHRVHALLMGGQACVFYGAAEFSRDTDLAVLTDTANWGRLLTALNELRAECIAVPPAEMQYLLRGHAIHFRCHHPEAENIFHLRCIFGSCVNLMKMREEGKVVRWSINRCRGLLSGAKVAKVFCDQMRLYKWLSTNDWRVFYKVPLSVMVKKLQQFRHCSVKRIAIC